jgi:hypothetical protein
MSYVIMITANGSFLGNDGNTYVEGIEDAFVSDSVSEINHFFVINNCSELYCKIVEVYNP